MRNLAGANAILTGASRGLGVLIARALAAEGVNLSLAARSADALQRVRDEIAASGVRAISVPTDVGDAGQLENLVSTTERELGPVDILVNNAGIEGSSPFSEYPPEEIERLVRVNLTSPMLLTRLVLPGMLERRRGHIVNVGSLAGKFGLPYETPYATTKAGLVMFTQNLRAELIGTPIDCSVICPGFVAEVGMYADVTRETGVQVPRALITSDPQKVSKAVIKALKRGSSELIVNPVPMRGVLALAQFFPDVSARLLKGLGVTELARRAAQTRSEAATRPDSSV